MKIKDNMLQICKHVKKIESHRNVIASSNKRKDKK